jgi:hypothetical protein
MDRYDGTRAGRHRCQHCGEEVRCARCGHEFKDRWFEEHTTLIAFGILFTVAAMGLGWLVS